MGVMLVELQHYPLTSTISFPGLCILNPWGLIEPSNTEHLRRLRTLLFEDDFGGRVCVCARISALRDRARDMPVGDHVRVRDCERDRVCVFVCRSVFVFVFVCARS